MIKKENGKFEQKNVQNHIKNYSQTEIDNFINQAVTLEISKANNRFFTGDKPIVVIFSISDVCGVSNLDGYQSIPDAWWWRNAEWEKYPFCGIFRNKKNNKWFGLITSVDISKIDKGTGEVELLNIKLDEDKILQLVKKEGFYKAYHMNKKSWISIILNDTLNNKEIFELIDESYNLINDKK